LARQVGAPALDAAATLERHSGEPPEDVKEAVDEALRRLGRGPEDPPG
jgi:hypothetical protein